MFCLQAVKVRKPTEQRSCDILMGQVLFELSCATHFKDITINHVNLHKKFQYYHGYNTIRNTAKVMHIAFRLKAHCLSLYRLSVHRLVVDSCRLNRISLLLALLDCVSRANAVARASVVRPSVVRRPSSVRKTRFLRNRQAN